MSLEILNNPLMGSYTGPLSGNNDQNLSGSSFPVLKPPAEFKQLTAKQIANMYYDGKPVAEGNGYKIYSDDPKLEGDIEEVVIYKTRFRQVINGIDVVLFASKSGAFLLQRYLEALPESNQLILFLEIDDRYNHHTVMRAVAGASLTQKKDMPFADILTFTRKHEVAVEPKVLKNLIEKGIYRNKVSLISQFLGLKDASIAKIFDFFKQELLQGAADFFMKDLADNISELRIFENGWNPHPKEGEYDPAFIPEMLHRELKKYYEHSFSKNPYENLEGQKKINTKIVQTLFKRINAAKTYFNNLLNTAENFFPAFIHKKLKQSLNLFFRQIDTMEKFLADPLTGLQHIMYRSHQIANAFLCGIYNSFIDIIAGIFSIIGFIFKAVAAMDKIKDRKVEYGEMFLELMEDLTEGIMKFDFAGFFYQCITFQMKTAARLVKWINEVMPEFTLEKAGYYYGYIIGIIVDIIVETLLTGGTAAVARLAKTVESFMLKPLEKISKAITKTADFLTRILEFFQMILREFKKGRQEIFSKLEKFLDEVFGFGGKVSDNALTPAEKRWKDKQRKIQEKLERKRKGKKAGMADNLDTGINAQMTVKEFEEGLKKLSKIKPEKALEHLDEAMIYFNHHIVDGKIVQISDRNCVNVVQMVEDFLRTGKISVAKVSKAQEVPILMDKYGGHFLTVKLETINNSNYFKIGERGILLCERGPNDYDHVLNVFMTKKGIMYKDAQSFSQKFVTEEYFKKEYKSYKLLKTKKN
ncbi:hypothetical protein HNP38_002031 [Chryseobacterium defluvii]|uniref:Uncharacterized protein n=1 Tax=Chryseobacterium defluvii TaxID=160396 RepID=A0A840KDU8_9FLAO|nr:hypothetical protein [Chryseobacterium defluvii]MBB4806735.1 hypothetical protein [Chryseobacterium defluvii]